MSDRQREPDREERHNKKKRRGGGTSTVSQTLILKMTGNLNTINLAL